jgi:hypothetical protein
MNLKAWWQQYAAVIVLTLVWIGIWGAWIPAKAASLTQNALYLAEWSTISPEARFQGMSYLAEALRLSVALAVIALAISANAIRGFTRRWLVRTIAALPGLVILPPYPYVLDLWRSASYGNRFIVAAVLFIGVAACVIIDILPRKLRHVMITILCLASAALGIWTFLVLRVLFEVRYTGVILPGWGLGLYVAGLLVTTVTQVAALARSEEGADMAVHEAPAQA